MAVPTVSDRIEHTLRSIVIIEAYWAGKSFVDFTDPKNEPYRAATERHLLIIAEAIKHIPDDDKAIVPQIPWRDVVAIGNILRHGYDIIDERRIWDVVRNDLAPLTAAVETIRLRH